MRAHDRKRLFLLAGEKASCNPLLSKLSKLFPCNFSNLSALETARLSAYSAAIIDLEGAGPSSLRTLSSQVRTDTCPDLFFIVDSKNRLEIAQAEALGAIALLPRDDPLGQIVETIRSVESSSSPNIANPIYSQKVNTALVKTDQLFNELGVIVGEARQVPLNAVLSCARCVIGALKDGTISEWMTAVQQHHSHTYRHSMLVSGITSKFAETLGLSTAQCQLLTVGALVHDIGKTMIPVSILDKPGQLTRKEFELVKRHAAYGDQILSASPEIPAAIRLLTRHHHEFLDGTGYPDGLTNNQIPKMVRILTICDIYAALIEQRSYKKAMSSQKALQILAHMDGKLDPILLCKFTEIMTGSMAMLGEIRRLPTPRSAKS